MRFMKKFIFLVSVIILFFLIYYSSEISELFLYFDSQNVTSLNNFFVTKDEIKSHLDKFGNNIDVESISLKLSVDMNNRKIFGTEIIAFRLKREIKPVFNFDDKMKIKEVKLSSNKIKYERENNFLSIDSVLKTGRLQTLKIQYSGCPENGLYFYDRNSAKYLYSVNEPIFASGWFACNDTPADKFMFTLQVTVDSGYTAISNGRKILDSLSGGKRKVLWESSYPVASYLTALYVGKYSRTSKTIIIGNDTLNMEIYSYPEDIKPARKTLSIAKDAVIQLCNFYGQYPFIKDKFAVVEIPWNYGGIENQTAIGIGENYFRSPEMFNELFIHETAHEWWGNSVGIKSWDDIWIDEGMANYSQALYWKGEAGNEAFKATMLSMLNNALRKGKIRGRERNLFGKIVYDKSAWIFRMLNYELGDSVFIKSLKNYQALYKYKTGNTQKLKTVFEKTSGKNLDRFFSQWIWDESGYIDLDCNFKMNDNSRKIILDIRQKSEKTYTFILPVGFYNHGEKIGEKNFRINSKDTAITVGASGCDSVAFDPDYTLLIKRKCK